jgi:hypothetical protein
VSPGRFHCRAFNTISQRDQGLEDVSNGMLQTSRAGNCKINEERLAGFYAKSKLKKLERIGR